MEQPNVLIVILNYKTYNLTIELVKEIRSRLEYSNYEIMVIDNCSPNESADVLSSLSRDMNFLFIANKVNSGYAAGNNIGIRYAINHGFDYSWIVNNDIILREENILAHMVEIGQSNKKIGCIGPKIYSLNNTICAPYVNRPSFLGLTFCIRSERKKRNRFRNTSMPVYRTHGCCMLLKNECMKEIDCLDEKTFLYGEEDILAERMLQKSYTSYYDSEVSVVHKECSSIKATKKAKRIKIRETLKSGTIYLRDYRKFNKLQIFLCNFVRLVIIYLR